MAALTVMLCMQASVTAWGGYFGPDVTDPLAAIVKVMQEFGPKGMALG